MRRAPKRTTRAAILVFLLAAAFLAGRLTAPRPSYRPSNICPVLRVVDGDTVKVRYAGEEQSVRLLRVNTPERGEPGYKEATEALRELVDGHTVRLEFEGNKKRDHYGRLLAYVFVDDVNVNVEMVRSGWSAFYTKHGEGRHAGAFKQAENEAREAGRGSWGLSEE